MAERSLAGEAVWGTVAYGLQAKDHQRQIRCSRPGFGTQGPEAYRRTTAPTRTCSHRIRWCCAGPRIPSGIGQDATPSIQACFRARHHALVYSELVTFSPSAPTTLHPRRPQWIAQALLLIELKASLASARQTASDPNSPINRAILVIAGLSRNRNVLSVFTNPSMLNFGEPRSPAPEPSAANAEPTVSPFVIVGQIYRGATCL